MLHYRFQRYASLIETVPIEFQCLQSDYSFLIFSGKITKVDQYNLAKIEIEAELS